MANQRYEQGSLENTIRNIVLDVLAERFLGTQATRSSFGEGNVSAGPMKIQRRRRSKLAKGRVTDPSTDKRLKVNRGK